MIARYDTYGSNMHPIKHKFKMLFSTLLTAGFLLLFSFSAQAQEWELVWSDEFGGEELDLSKWTFQLGTGANYGLINWGNNEQQFYTDREENLFIQDGMLHIRALQEQFSGRSYTSARIRSYNKGDWTYGRFEVRAKLPEGQGLWPAIWMMPTDNVYGGWPQSGEIDIMEALGHQPHISYGSVHYGPVWPNNRFRTGSITKPEGTFSEDFSVYAIEWEPGVIRFYVDDQLFFIVTENHLAPYNWPFDQRFHFILNVAVGGHWPGYPDETTEFPQEMIVDYVRVYQDPAFTSIGDEPSETPNRIELKQNYPNPFNPTTQIEYTLPDAAPVVLEVFNMMGQRIATLVDGTQSAGSHTVSFDASNLSSGIYLYRLTSGSQVLTQKMTLVK
ncbi:MAG: family 16 glycosylhydrolase [Balneolales bacterium]|nr:family 16 glycosylhydrolase [Balneolales bacterium]